MNETRKCTCCGLTKPADQYYAGYVRCKVCHIEANKRTQRVKRDHYNEYRRNYARQHPEKAAQWHEASRKRYDAIHGEGSYLALQAEKKRTHYHYLRINDPEQLQLILDAKSQRKRGKKQTAEQKRKKRAYYLKNRERLLEYYKERHKNLTEEQKQKRKEYRLLYYQRNKTKVKAESVMRYYDNKRAAQTKMIDPKTSKK